VLGVFDAKPAVAGTVGAGYLGEDIEQIGIAPVADSVDRHRETGLVRRADQLPELARRGGT
jgi:hypothetical protein